MRYDLTDLSVIEREEFHHCIPFGVQVLFHYMAQVNLEVKEHYDFRNKFGYKSGSFSTQYNIKQD